MKAFLAGLEPAQPLEFRLAPSHGSFYDEDILRLHVAVDTTHPLNEGTTESFQNEVSLLWECGDKRLNVEKVRGPRGWGVLKPRIDLATYGLPSGNPTMIAARVTLIRGATTMSAPVLFEYRRTAADAAYEQGSVQSETRQRRLKSLQALLRLILEHVPSQSRTEAAELMTAESIARFQKSPSDYVANVIELFAWQNIPWEQLMRVDTRAEKGWTVLHYCAALGLVRPMFMAQHLVDELTYASLSEYLMAIAAAEQCINVTRFVEFRSGDWKAILYSKQVLEDCDLAGSGILGGPRGGRRANERPPSARHKLGGDRGLGSSGVGLGASDGLSKQKSYSRFQPSCSLPALLAPLPSYWDAAPEGRQALFVKKLRQCQATFDFTNDKVDEDSKRVKETVLREIADVVSSDPSVLSDATFPELITLLRANLLRTLPPHVNPSGVAYDPEEDEPILEAAWPHIQIVYEVLLRVIECPSLEVSVTKRYLTQQFLGELLELFDSEDPRERDSLKTIVHRIYGKLLGLRVFIRTSINNVFFAITYENARHNGVAELLEILGSIINGFAVPLKAEHTDFLVKVLMPLHKVSFLSLFHPQLAYCVVQYIDKDSTLTSQVVDGLLRYWPRASRKEVMFLNEMEEILDQMNPNEFEAVHQRLFQRLARCAESLQFQVAERALMMFKKDYALGLIMQHYRTILPIMFGPLYRNSKVHWNRFVHSMIYHTLKLFMDADAAFFDECSKAYKKQRTQERMETKRREKAWSEMEKRYQAKQVPKGAAGTPGADDSGSLPRASRISYHKARYSGVPEAPAAGDSDVLVGVAAGGVVSAVAPNPLLRRKSLLPKDAVVTTTLRRHQSLEDTAAQPHLSIREGVDHH